MITIFLFFNMIIQLARYMCYKIKKMSEKYRISLILSSQSKFQLPNRSIVASYCTFNFWCFCNFIWKFYFSDICKRSHKILMQILLFSKYQGLHVEILSDVVSVKFRNFHSHITAAHLEKTDCEFHLNFKKTKPLRETLPFVY